MGIVIGPKRSIQDHKRLSPSTVRQLAGLGEPQNASVDQKKLPVWRVTILVIVFISAIQTLFLPKRAAPATPNRNASSLPATAAVNQRPDTGSITHPEVAVNQLDRMSLEERQLAVDTVVAQLRGLAHPFIGSDDEESNRRKERQLRYAGATDRCYFRTNSVLARNICLRLIDRAKELNGDD